MKLPLNKSSELAGEPSRREIFLDYDASIVRTFLDSTYARHDFPIDKNVADFTDLFKLCDQFRAPSQAEYITRALSSKLSKGGEAPLDPWEVFKLAAKRDKVDLARLAASKLQEDSRSLTHLIFCNTSSFFEDVPSRYMHALIRCSVWHHDQVQLPWGDIGGAWIKHGPADIAKWFSLD